MISCRNCHDRYKILRIVTFFISHLLVCQQYIQEHKKLFLQWVNEKSEKGMYTLINVLSMAMVAKTNSRQQTEQNTTIKTYCGNAYIEHIPCFPTYILGEKRARQIK